MEKVMFGAGCFWGVEASFRKLNGVIDVVSGYSGGYVDNPSYRQVCAGTTGHAEVVEVTFDSAKISFEELLNNFWKCHDPTQLDRQGPDVGRQYRSVIFTYNEDQQNQAELSKKKINESDTFSKPIVTEIKPALTFWRAEDYHQRYYG